MNLEKAVADLAEKIERRFYGKYRGFVVDNNDPEQLGRLKLQVPSVLGENIVTGWALPCVPYGGDANTGFFFVPEVRAGVWVEFEEGDLEFPIWTGTFWSKPDGETEVPKPIRADGKEQDVHQEPSRKIIKTKAGHTIQFEDADENAFLVIVDGSNKNVITLNSSGIELKNKNGTSVLIEGSNIKLGGSGAFEPVVQGIKLLTWLATHQHPTVMGPSGPPVKLPMKTDFCSDTSFTL